MHRLLIPACFLLLTAQLSAQELPRLPFSQTSGNFHTICSEMDAWFADAWEQEETDCWDNNYVKYRRWKWFWADRVLEDGSFPDLKAQWQVYREKESAAQSRNGAPAWINEGPFENTGGGYWGMGRTKHVAFDPVDPLTFYIGTPAGGLWKTSDGGLTYEPLGDRLPYLPAGIIRVDHQAPQTLYVSLGDKYGWWNYNLGVYKSTDGGQNWQATGLDWELSESRVIYALEMDPVDPKVLWAATNNGLLRTMDGGDHWATVRTGEHYDLKYRPDDPNTLYTTQRGAANGTQVFKSTDGGQVWNQVSDLSNDNSRVRLAVTLADPNYLGVLQSDGKKFYLSENGGLDLEYKSELPEDFAFYFSQTNPDVVYCGYVVVYKSEDKGASWVQITNWYNNGFHDEVHADLHDIVHYPHNPEVLFFCNDGGVYTYYEPDGLWTDYSNGLGIAQFYRIALSESGSLKIAAGSQDNGGWLRMPSGTWRHTNGGDAMCQAIDPTNNNVIYTEYYGGNAIYRSDNNFITSVEISNNLPDDPSGDWVTPFLLNPQNPNTFLVGFEDIYRSFDRGNTFHKLTTNLTGAIGNDLRDLVMSATDTNQIVGTWRNRVYRTLNGGQSWTMLTTPDANSEITRIDLHPVDQDRMWVTKAGYSAGKKVYESFKINNLTAWKNISGNLPNAPVNCILFDPPTNYLFVGTDVGVFYTDADDIDWQPFGTGMPNVYVLDLKIRQATRVLYAATHGRGVYSVDLNQSSAAAPPAAASSGALSVFPNPAGEAVYFGGAAAELSGATLRLYDAYGRLCRTLHTGSSTAAQMRFGLEGLAGGVYFLEMTDGEGSVLGVQKVVKR